MRGITLDYLEDKARSNQEASAIAWHYAFVFVYAPEQRKHAQEIHALTSASARRYLWAAIDRRRSHSDLMREPPIVYMSNPERESWLRGEFLDEDDRGSVP